MRVLSGGHINDTYLVDERFVLQRINHFVFPNPGDIMDNMLGVTKFLREKVLARGGDPEREILQIVHTAAGEPFYIDKHGNYWRCTLHIDGTASYETSLKRAGPSATSRPSFPAIPPAPCTR